ncbi:MAG: type IV pilus modification PilV family protein [Chitinophagales bacterium]
MGTILEKLRDEKGMTLIEILAALTILTMAIMVIITSFTTAIIWNAESGRRTRAIYFGSEVIEELKSNPSLVTNTSGYVDYSSRVDYIAPPLGIGAKVSIFDYDTTLKLHTVLVKPTWNTRGIERSDSLQTVIRGDS